MDYKTVLLLQYLADIVLACLLAPWLVWRFRRRLGWAAILIDRVFDWVAE